MALRRPFGNELTVCRVIVDLDESVPGNGMIVVSSHVLLVFLQRLRLEVRDVVLVLVLSVVYVGCLRTVMDDRALVIRVRLNRDLAYLVRVARDVGVLSS